MKPYPKEGFSFFEFDGKSPARETDISNVGLKYLENNPQKYHYYHLSDPKILVCRALNVKKAVAIFLTIVRKQRDL